MIRGALLLTGVLLLTAAAEKPANPKLLSPAEGAEQARALIAEMLFQQPSRNLTNTGVLTIRDSKRKETAIPVQFAVAVTASNWLSIYSTRTNDKASSSAFIVAHSGPANNYLVPNFSPPSADTNELRQLGPTDLMKPFAGSDFWLVDLALDFFQWPGQRVLKTEPRRSRSCKVLESINPNPAAGGYSKVVSWIDTESGGIVHADAFDAKGKLLKEFDPKDFKKVNGEWQLEEMEIRNVQTGSRTRIEFNLNAKPAE